MEQEHLEKRQLDTLAALGCEVEQPCTLDVIIDNLPKVICKSYELIINHNKRYISYEYYGNIMHMELFTHRSLTYAAYLLLVWYLKSNYSKKK